MAQDGGEWPASHPNWFTARERASGIQWIAGWVGLRAGLDAVVPALARNRTPEYQLSNP